MVGTGRFELPNGSALPRTPRRLDWSTFASPRRRLGRFAGRQFFLAFAKLLS